jgi:anti-sigma regulatory factor (Ser/Thr protein kinase)
MSPETMILPGETSSVPAARRFVERTLEGWSLDPLAWAAALLISELTANACLHARTQLAVTLTRTAEGDVRLEVRDGSAVVPRMRRYAEEATTGRGLRLVGELASQWGVEQVAGGKVVWAVLATDHEGSRADRDDEPVDADLGVDELLAMFPDESGPAAPRARCAA